MGRSKIVSSSVEWGFYHSSLAEGRRKPPAANKVCLRAEAEHLTGRGAPSHENARAHANARACVLARAHTHSLTHAHTHTRAHTHAHTYTHTLTHTHTHTHKARTCAFVHGHIKLEDVLR